MMVRGQKALITLISIVIFLALSSFVMADDGCCCEQSSPNPENYYLDANECAGVYGTFEIMTEDMLYAAHISYGDDLELFCENRCTLTPAELCGNGLLDTDELCDPGNQPGADENLDGQTCLLMGFSGGTLSCNNDCAFNNDSCDVDEECTTNADCDVDKECIVGVCVPISVVICDSGECDVTNNWWCNASNAWKPYNLNIPAQKTEYCNNCPGDFADCTQSSDCTPDTSNRNCPTGCLASAIPGNPDFDPDCVCLDNTENTCPDGTVDCYDELDYCPDWCSGDENQDNYDVSCEESSTTGYCGDGVIQIWEQCEQDSDCGDFLCNSNNCVCTNIPLTCADLDSVECNPGDVNADGLVCQPNCMWPETCEINNGITLLVMPQQGEKAMDLSWSIGDSSCQVTYSIYKCNQQEDSTCSDNDFTKIAETSNQAYTDEDNLEAEKTYCYRVETVVNGELKISNEVCRYMGDNICFDQEYDQFCMNNAGFECDEYNNATLITEPDNMNCTLQDEYCIRSRNEGEPTDFVECREPAPCDFCNGVFAMYAAYSSEFIVPYEDDELFFCKDLPTCVYDQTKTTADKYYDCSEITSCYDLYSENTCEDDGLCGTHDCEWMNINPELGLGVCISTNPDEQNCSACEEPWCNKDLCSYYGECYYDGAGGAIIYGCIPQSKTTCKIFDTKEDCLGSSEENFEINVTYEGVDRIYPSTHEILQESNSYFDYTKCKWDEEGTGNKCYRDADDNSASYPTEPLKKDCDSSDYRCNLDFESPTTTLEAEDGQTFSNDLDIAYSVFDNEYSSQDIITYYCLANRSETCYPSEDAEGAIMGWLDINDSKPMTLFYYSEDFAKNLEVVQSINIIIDGSPFNVTIIDTILSQERIGDTDTWLTNLSITLSPSRLAVCDARLTNESGNVQPYNNINNLLGTSWSRNYKGLVDGYYTYSYECEDTLGQTLEGSKVIRIDGDMSISNPQPNRTINYKDNIILSIDTLLAGTCKYSVDEPLYAAMTQEFNSSTSGTHQTANFSAPGTNFYRFYTACDFLQEGIHKITEANTADEIRFAVDLAPPTAHAYNDATGEPFDFSSTYQEAKIRFNCSDQLIWWEAHDWSFGCNKTFYSVETGCDLPTFQRNRFIEQTTPFVKRLDTTGTNKICYFAQDKGGNNETIQSQTVKIDNTPPEFTIEIENVQNNILGFGNYKINIATNETAEITSIMFEDLQYEFNWTQDGEMSWHTFLNINEQTLPGIYSETILEVKGIDTANNEGGGYLNVIIDTITPKAPEFEPEFSEYPQLNYPLNEYEEVFYTNQQDLFVSGHTDNTQETIEFYLNAMVVETYVQKLDNSQEQEPTKIARTDQYATALFNETELILSSSAILEDWDSGYINIVSHERTSYGNYKKYYQIISAEAHDFDTVKLIISPELEQEIPANTQIELFDKELPFNWFGLNLELEEGLSEIRIGYTNYMGFNVYTPPYNLFYDSNIPIIEDIMPKDETINEPNTNITFTIYDEAIVVPTNALTIAHYVEGVGETISNTLTCEEQDYTATKKKYLCTATTNQPLEDGLYNVTLELTDLAGNELIETWQFEANEDALSSPDYRWKQGFIQPSPQTIYYINSQTPEFVLVYPVAKLFSWNITLLNENNNINCQEISFEDLDEDIKTELDEPLVSTVLDCNFTNVLAEQAYDLRAEAIGNISGNLTDPGYKIFDIEVDLEIPDYTLEMPLVTRSNASVPIDLTITNENEAVVLIEVDGTEETLPVFGTGTSFHADIPAEFDWGVPYNQEQDKQIILTISDYAGNNVEETKTITIDNKPPRFSIISVEPQCLTLDPDGQCTTNAINLVLEGNCTTDTIRIEAFEGTEKRGDIFSCTTPGQNCINGDDFSMNITLESATNQEIMTTLVLKATDKAGNTFERNLDLLRDMLPPAQPTITIQ